MDRTCWPHIEAYVRDIIRYYRHDSRICVWDLYNDPGNGGIFCSTGEFARYDDRLEIYALTLLTHLFSWARQESPSQPLTVAARHIDDRTACGNAFTHPIDVAALRLSDVISYHAYVDTRANCLFCHSLLSLADRFSVPNGWPATLVAE